MFTVRVRITLRAYLRRLVPVRTIYIRPRTYVQLLAGYGPIRAHACTSMLKADLVDYVHKLGSVRTRHKARAAG